MSALLRGVHGIKSLLITESAAIRIDYNFTRVYYFTHTTRGPCDSPNRSRRARGYSRQPFPTRLNRWGYAQLARGDLVPPRTSLNFPTHSSTRGPAKPPCIARWPRIWDRAPMIKSKKVFGSSVPLYWICGSTEMCSRPMASTRSLIDPSGLCPCDFILEALLFCSNLDTIKLIPLNQTSAIKGNQ